MAGLPWPSPVRGWPTLAWPVAERQESLSLAEELEARGLALPGPAAPLAEERELVAPGRHTAAIPIPRKPAVWDARAQRESRPVSPCARRHPRASVARLVPGSL